ncbi:MAG: DUF935 family protein, partial [Desulfobacteraceae bacterium]|nr:DUF935 family protein [Desulfobacteraceae bacterium]
SEKQTSVLDIKWVRADRVTFWNSLTPRVLTVDEPVQGIDLPPYKFIYHRYKARSGDDMRAGILRPVSWMFVFKNYSVKDWVAFAEIYGQPLRLGKYDPGASDEEKDALVLAVQSIGTDAAGIISRKTEIEFKDTVARNSTENVYSGLAGFCDRQMSKAILGQTLTSESGDKGSGSYALGSVHDRVRFDLKNSDASSLSKTFRSQFVRPFVGYNFGWDAPVPKYRLICEKPEDLEKIGKIYQVVTDIGLDVSQEHVSERFQIPMRKRGETPLLTMQQQPIPVENTLKMIPENTLKMKTGNPHADLEEMSFQASENTFSAFEEDILKPVLGMLEGVETYEEAGELLYEMFSDLDMRAFEELLTRSVLAAGLSGYGASCDDAAE